VHGSSINNLKMFTKQRRNNFSNTIRNDDSAKGDPYTAEYVK